MRRALLLLALAAACGIATAAGPAPATSAPFLWEIEGPQARHYLLGSVHLLPPSAHPLPAALDAAYRATKAVVFETDLGALADPEVQGSMLGAAREDRPGGLKGQIGKSLYARLQERAAALGLPTPLCDDFRAWFCALTLELYPFQQAGFGVEYGIDQHFYARARDDGRPVAGLESAAYQVALFADMPEALSKDLLAATLDQQTYSGQPPDELFRIWRAGDAAALEKLMRDMRKRYPELYQRLLSDRNRAWMPQLTERFRGAQPQLVIVGAAHLIGPDGLLALLKAQGLESKPAPGVLELAEPPAAEE